MLFLPRNELENEMSLKETKLTLKKDYLSTSSTRCDAYVYLALVLPFLYQYKDDSFSLDFRHQKSAIKKTVIVQRKTIFQNIAVV